MITSQSGMVTYLGAILFVGCDAVGVVGSRVCRQQTYPSRGWLLFIFALTTFLFWVMQWPLMCWLIVIDVLMRLLVSTNSAMVVGLWDTCVPASKHFRGSKQAHVEYTDAGAQYTRRAH